MRRVRAVVLGLIGAAIMLTAIGLSSCGPPPPPPSSPKVKAIP
ncbi:MAG TPA: hypothetical protein VNE39_19725 [Planctomycetota bacterium]|nr:hypothetical protein [Planctomycetota bacterium]